MSGRGRGGRISNTSRGNYRGREVGSHRSTRSKSANADSNVTDTFNPFASIQDETRDPNSAQCINCKITFVSSSDHMLQCERCDEWKCQECASITDTEYEFLTKRKDMHWFCDECDLLAMSAVITDADIEDKCKKYCRNVEDRIEALETALPLKADKIKVDEIDVKLKSLEDVITRVASDISNTNNRVELASSEQEEKAKRVKNVVIRGLAETTPPNDLEVVKQIFADIDCPDIEIETVQRLGKKPNSQSETSNDVNDTERSEEATASNRRVENQRHRPIRIIVRTEEEKRKIIRNATKVRKVDTNHYDPKKIFILPDLTKLEREKDIDLRKNLRKKREDFPNERFVIRNWRIIKL